MRLILTLLLLGILAVAGRADTPRGILSGVGFDQNLGAQVPLDLPFRDETGAAVKLEDYFNGKPVILVLAYYRCPMLCTQVLNGLLDSLQKISFDVGNQFNVVTVSFDPHDSPRIASAKKANYLERYGRPQADRGWHFLTGEQAAIGPLTRAVGFRYRYDASIDQYAHPSGILVLTPQGKIARYFAGVQFTPRDLQATLVEASDNRIGSLTDQAFLFCYQYDETTGKYTPQVMRLVRLFGVLTLVGLGAMILVLRRREANGSGNGPVVSFQSTPTPVGPPVKRCETKRGTASATHGTEG